MLKALRLGKNSYIREEIFEKYLKMVKDNLDVVDEVTLFADASHHGYTPYETTLETAKAVKEAIKAYKALGVKKVGINVLATIGHTDDGSGLCEKADMQYMVNIKNQESGSCLCPADERFIKYIKQKYAAYAKTGTDYIWMDDDVRTGNHGIVTDYCFCPLCVEKYNKRYSKNYTLDEIRSEWDNNKELRDTWKECSYDSLCNMVNEIHDAIKAVNPDIEIGYMSGGCNYVYEWIDASKATKGRPGGGYFNDRFTLELFEKSFWIQKELSVYPDRVTDIQYEYESYNGRTLEKSFHTSEMETSLCIMVGCNGILYNRSTMLGEPKFFGMLRNSKKKWDVLCDANKDCENLGIYCASAVVGRQMNEISIPVTSNLKASSAAIVLGDEWNDYTDEEIEEILDKNVFTDGRGVEVLAERGFRKDICASVDKTYPNGVIEYFHNHSLNGEFSGKTRYASMDIYYEGDAYQLIPDSNAEVITSLKADDILGCAMCCAQMKNGRRVVADGYLMPGQAQTASKRTQMMNVFEWLSDNSLPVIIEKSIKVVPIVRGKNKEPENIMLCNAHFDATEEFVLEVRSDKEFYMISDNGELIEVEQKHENGKTYITINNIPGWNYVLLTSNRE